MKLPWTKRKRGAYRSAKQRASEEQSTIDLMMLQAWKDDLRRNPQYLREIARQKFGMSDMGMSEGMVGEPTTFLDKISEVKEGKDKMDSIFGGGQAQKQGMLLQVAEIMKAVPDFGKGLKDAAEGLAKLKEIGGLEQLSQEVQPQQQISQVEQPQQLERAPEQPPTEETKTLNMVARLVQSPPEQVASELYQHREDKGDIRSVVFNFILGSDVDRAMDTITTVINKPEYNFLINVVQGLNLQEFKKWLALVIDECNNLSSPELIPELSEEEMLGGE